MSYPPAPDHGQAYPGPRSWPPIDSSVPSLNQPYYRIGPAAAVNRALKNYATFSGRASRSEFWWWTLFTVLFCYLPPLLIVAVNEVLAPTGRDPSPWAIAPLATGWVIGLLGLLVPTIAVTVRRLHDANYSGWLYLIALVPYLGGLALLILCALPSSPVGARFDQGAQPPALTFGQPMPYGQQGTYGQQASYGPYEPPPTGQAPSSG